MSCGVRKGISFGMESTSFVRDGVAFEKEPGRHTYEMEFEDDG